MFFRMILILTQMTYSVFGNSFVRAQMYAELIHLWIVHRFNTAHVHLGIQLADRFIKGLPIENFQDLISMLGMIDIHLSA